MSLFTIERIGILKPKKVKIKSLQIPVSNSMNYTPYSQANYSHTYRVNNDCESMCNIDVVLTPQCQDRIFLPCQVISYILISSTPNVYPQDFQGSTFLVSVSLVLTIIFFCFILKDPRQSDGRMREESRATRGEIVDHCKNCLNLLSFLQLVRRSRYGSCSDVVRQSYTTGRLWLVDKSLRGR